MRCNTSFAACSIIIAVAAVLRLLVSITPTVFLGPAPLETRITMSYAQSVHPEHVQEQIKWDFESGRKNDWVVDHRGVPIRTVRRYRKTYNETGEVYIPSIIPGRPRALPEYVILAIQTYLTVNPDAYLAKIDFILWDDFGICVSLQTIGRAILKDLKIIRKKLQRIAAQQDPKLRARFYIRME